MSKQYIVKKYLNRLIWYVYDSWNRCVVSTPWYVREHAQNRADWFNEDEDETNG